MQNSKACDGFICLAFRIDFVEVMSDVTCHWGPRQADYYKNSKLRVSYFCPSYWAIFRFGLINPNPGGQLFICVCVLLAVSTAHKPLNE